MTDPVKFFSVLGALARAAPQSMTGAQWQRYLQPGRILTREGVKFPLKKDELLYGTGPELLKRLEPSQTFSPGYLAQLHDELSHLNPELHRLIPSDMRAEYGGGYSGSMSYPNQYQLPGPKFGQQEHLTTIPQAVPGSGYTAGSHFGSRPGLLSWNRTTDRNVIGPSVMTPDELKEYAPLKQWDLLPNEGTPEERARYQYLRSRDRGPISTHLEETQSDWHQKAREQGYQEPFDYDTAHEAELTRMLNQMREGGFEVREPEHLRIMERLARSNTDLLQSKAQSKGLPDAPYKDSWMSLEARKALADAVSKDHDYLTWTTGQQQVDRYPGLDEGQRAGMLYSYDQDLPSRIQKLSRQYGGPDVGTAQLPDIKNLDRNDPKWGYLTSLLRPPETIRDEELVHGLNNLFPDRILPEDVENAVMDVHYGHTAANEAFDNWKQTNSLTDKREFFDLREQYQSAVKKLEPFLASQPPQTVHALPLTPELKDRVRKAGLPLFSAGALGALTAPPPQEDTPMNGYARGGRVRRFASGGASSTSNKNPLVIPPLGITVNTDPLNSGLYGFGPSFPFIEYGSQTAPPPPPPVTPPPVVPPPTGTPGAGGGGGAGGSFPPGLGGNQGPTGSGHDNAASGSGAAGAAGDYAGRRVADVSAALAGLPADPGSAYLTIPGWANNALRAVQALAPWQVSLPLAAAREAAGLYDTSVTDQVRASQSIAPLSTGQWFGSAAGFNPYGDLTNPAIASAEQLQPAIDAANANVAGAGPMADFFRADPTLGTPKAETLTGQPANYGPFGLFGTTGPAVSYENANLALNPSAAATVLAEMNGQSVADALAEIRKMQASSSAPAPAPPSGALSSGNAGGVQMPGAFGGYSADARANQVAAGNYPRNPHPVNITPGGVSINNGGGSGNAGGAQNAGGVDAGGGWSDPTHEGASSPGEGHKMYAAGGQVSPKRRSGVLRLTPDWREHVTNPDESLWVHHPHDTDDLPPLTDDSQAARHGNYARGGLTSELGRGLPRSELAGTVARLGGDEDSFVPRLQPPRLRPLGPWSQGAPTAAPTLDLGLGDYQDLGASPPGPPPLDVGQPPPAPAPPPAVAQAPPPDQAPGGPVVPDQYKRQVAALEGGGKDDAVNPTTGAAGRYQFLASTWNDLARRHPELKLPAFDKMNWKDTAPQDLAFNAFTRENADTLRQRYGISDPGPAEQYVAHLLGASGGGRLLAAVRTDPDAPVTRYVAPAAVVANKNVFYGPQGPLTVRQAYDRLARSVAAGRWDLAA